MSSRDEEGHPPERRAVRRYKAEHAARLQFVTGIAGAAEYPDDELWPNLICRTRDVSEGGLGLVVPALREGDETFFGIEGPVRVTPGLPTGALEARGVAARYAKEGGEGRGEFLVCVRITGMDVPDAGRFRAYLCSLSRGG